MTWNQYTATDRVKKQEEKTTLDSSKVQYPEQNVILEYRRSDNSVVVQLKHHTTTMSCVSIPQPRLSVNRRTNRIDGCTRAQWCFNTYLRCWTFGLRLLLTPIIVLLGPNGRGESVNVCRHTAFVTGLRKDGVCSQTHFIYCRDSGHYDYAAY